MPTVETRTHATKKMVHIKLLGATLCGGECLPTCISRRPASPFSKRIYTIHNSIHFVGCELQYFTHNICVGLVL